MSKRRSIVRVHAALHVVIRTHDQDIACFTKDLGQGGLFALTEHRFEKGTELLLRLVPTFSNFQLRARVAHVQPNGVGLSFVEPDEEARRRLAFLVDDLVAKGTPTDEKRKSTRSGAAMAIVWREGSMQQESRVKDLNRDGAYVLSDQPPTVGTRVFLYLPAPGDRKSPGKVVGCEAHVVHNQPDGFGVKLVKPSREFAQAWRSRVKPG